jgi:hypothetical protein
VEDEAEGEGAEDVGDAGADDVAEREVGALLTDGGDDDGELAALVCDHDGGVGRTSSHSPPAVSSDTSVGETPIRLATTTEWSTKLSAPHSRRNRPATNEHAL